MLLVNTLRFLAVAHLDKGTTIIGRRAIEYSMRLLKQTRRRKGNDRYGNRCDKALAFESADFAIFEVFEKMGALQSMRASL